MYVLREVCHTEFHRLPEVIKNIIFFSSLFTFVVGGLFFFNQFSVISIVVITIIIIIMSISLSLSFLL